MNILNELNFQYEKILFEFAQKLNWVPKNNDINKLRYELKGVEYKEPTLPIYSFDKITYNYTFLYSLFHADSLEEHDPYTRYFVDLKDNMIVGVRMES